MSQTHHHNIKMVGEVRQLVLEDLLNEKQIHHILNQSIGENVPKDFKGSELHRAMDGIAGFVGDHMKAVLHVDVEGEKKKIHLFLKSLPVFNKPKAEFIDKHNFFRREHLMYKVLNEICEDGARPWCANAYVYTDSLVVMPDLTVEGYAPRSYIQTLDHEHIFLVTTSVAQFHAAYVNYETKKSINLNRPYVITEEYGDILEESTFCDSPWMRTCAKLSADLLNAFSKKGYGSIPDLEAKLRRLYLEACDSLREYEDTVNVLLHKDLWVNNIMFKYDNDAPVNAVLVDYQCIRYGPPAFDLMMLLYLTTDKRFREEREKDVFDHYYSVFVNNLNDDSNKRLESLCYDKDTFINWCERSRMFAMCLTIAIYPFTLMEPKTAEKIFDNSETYDKVINEDRSEPVLSHANRCEPYKFRNLEVTEEFVETYVL